MTEPPTAPTPDGSDDERGLRRDLLRMGAVVAIFLVAALPFSRVGTFKNRAWHDLDALDAIPDIAVIGDSRAHVGISPTALTSIWAARGLPGLTGHNFAVDGTDALHHYSFTLRGLLAEKRRPRVIVWAPSPLSVDMTRTSNRLEQVSSRDVKALAFAGAPLEVLLDLFTNGIYPPYRHRPPLREKLEDKIESVEQKLEKVQGRLLHLDVKHRDKPRTYVEESDGQEPFYTIGDWADRFERGRTTYRVNYEKLKLSDWHLTMARSLLRRAKERGTLVVVLELPVSPTYQKEFVSLRKHQEWQTRMKQIADEEGAVFVSDASLYASDALFGDPAHMDGMTSFFYSTALADRLLAIPAVRAALEAKR